MYSPYPRRRSRILYHRLAILILIPVLLAGVIIFLLMRALSGDPDSASSPGMQSAASPAASSRQENSFAVSSGQESRSASSSGGSVSAGNVSGAASAPISLKAELSQWYLKLVSASNPLPAGFAPSVADINAAYCRDPNFRFDSRAVEALNQMCAAAKQEGVKLLVISPYRSVQKQSQLFDDEVAEVRAKYKNLTMEEAKAKAAQVVLPPGTSEHNLGLAVDFDSLEISYENTAQFRWLSRRAAEFGFILRYPKDKTQITGVSYEPWHYRYVGQYHAAQIKAKGLCLEEYLEELKALPD